MSENQLPNPADPGSAESFRRPFLMSVGFIGAAVAFTFLGGRGEEANGKPPLGRTWKSSELVSLDAIDHAAWDELLRDYVDGQGLVDYKRWKASSEDVAKLDGYLDELSRGSTQVEAGREARLAFWINAYNAVTVKGILQVYPTTSIRNHTAKVVGYNIWNDLPLRVGGEGFSLNDIEHKILRKMGEPRIHFAIVCASIGCPRLLNEAYVSGRLEEQLAGNATHFFAQPQNFRFDAQQNKVYLSSILEWFGKDFGPTKAAVLQKVAPLLPSGEARAAALSDGVSVAYLDYDWNLNQQN
ncbi:MAG: DUF547 domain-containing protein [Planctomycetota bacterium]